MMSIVQTTSTFSVPSLSTSTEKEKPQTKGCSTEHDHGIQRHELSTVKSLVLEWHSVEGREKKDIPQTGSEAADSAPNVMPVFKVRYSGIAYTPGGCTSSTHSGARQVKSESSPDPKPCGTHRRPWGRAPRKSAAPA